MRDTEGWARVYDLGRATSLRDLADHWRGAERAGEDPGRPFYLPYDVNEVVPATFRQERSPWDENDRATITVEFRRADQYAQGEPVASVSYDVDGRS